MSGEQIVVSLVTDQPRRRPGNLVTDQPQPKRAGKGPA